VLLTALLIPPLVARIRAEETLLRTQFGGEYDAYCSRTIDSLIPTVVTVPSAPDAKITYPVGHVFKPKFSPEGISVYEGSVAIRAELPKGRLTSAASTPLRVDVQACTAQICLPPATLTTSVIQ
jgi:hypothetical protein